MFGKRTVTGHPPTTKPYAFTDTYAHIHKRVTVVFENWPDEFDPPLRRLVDPPRRVLVDPSLAVYTRPTQFGLNGVPLRVRNGGLFFGEKVLGDLDAVARLRTGEWICRVSFPIRTSNHHGHINLVQWCGMIAVTPLDRPA